MNDFDDIRDLVKQLQSLFILHMERLGHAIDAVEEAAITLEESKK